MRVLFLTMFLASGGCKKQYLPTATISVAGHTVSAELATTVEARTQGLMYRDGLSTDCGMLFVYPEPSPRRFWMKNVKFGLSIAFMDEAGKIFKIADMQPLSEERTHSDGPVKYALEMERGWFAAHDVKVGSLVTGIPDDLVVK